MLCSTFVDINPIDKCRRWSKERKTYVEVDRPSIVRVYNCHMGDVDLSDMIISLYCISIRSKRWYLRILYYLIDLSLANGWLLYRRHLIQKGLKRYLPFLDFRTEVADELIKVGKSADLNNRKRGRPSLENVEQAQSRPPPTKRVFAPSNDVRLDRFDHFGVFYRKAWTLQTLQKWLHSAVVLEVQSASLPNKRQKLLFAVSHSEVTSID